MPGACQRWYGYSFFVIFVEKWFTQARRLGTAIGKNRWIGQSKFRSSSWFSLKVFKSRSQASEPARTLVSNLESRALGRSSKSCSSELLLPWVLHIPAFCEVFSGTGSLYFKVSAHAPPLDCRPTWFGFIEDWGLPGGDKISSPSQKI